MGLCSCLAHCLAWGVKHWSLLVVEQSWVLALRQRSLGELSPIDIMWGWEVSGGLMSWSWLSHLRGSRLTPSWSTKTLSTTRSILEAEKSLCKLESQESWWCSSSPRPKSEGLRTVLEERKDGCPGETAHKHTSRAKRWVLVLVLLFLINMWSGNSACTISTFWTVLRFFGGFVCTQFL